MSSRHCTENLSWSCKALNCLSAIHFNARVIARTGMHACARPFSRKRSHIILCSIYSLRQHLHKSTTNNIKENLIIVVASNRARAFKMLSNFY